MDTTESAESAGKDPSELELYKILKNESASYFDKLQALWLQKFILMGGLIAFVITSQDKFAPTTKGIIVGAAIVSVPVLAALLDAKILEFSLHVRAISHFIEDHFGEPKTLSLWESTLWGV